MNRRARIAALTAAGIVLLGATAAVAGPVIYRDFIAAPPAGARASTGGRSTAGRSATATSPPSDGGGAGRLSGADVNP